MLYNILKDLSRRFSEPRVYALTIEGKEFVFMDLQVAYSLEEAFDQAQKEFLRLNPSFINRPLNSRIHFFCVKTLQELFGNNVALKSENSNTFPQTIPTRSNDRPNNKLPIYPPQNIIVNSSSNAAKPEIDPKKVAEIKNSLMKTIISTKDKNLMEANRSIFTENEIQFLLDKIEEATRK